MGSLLAPRLLHVGGGDVTKGRGVFADLDGRWVRVGTLHPEQRLYEMGTNRNDRLKRLGWQEAGTFYITFVPATWDEITRDADTIRLTLRGIVYEVDVGVGAEQGRWLQTIKGKRFGVPWDEFKTPDGSSPIPGARAHDDPKEPVVAYCRECCITSTSRADGSIVIDHAPECSAHREAKAS